MKTTQSMRRVLNQASAIRRLLKSERIQFVRRTYKRVLADKTGERLKQTTAKMVELGLYAKTTVDTDARYGYLRMAWRIDTGGECDTFNWASDPRYYINWVRDRGFTARGIPAFGGTK